MTAKTTDIQLEKRYNNHTHNGVDGKKVKFSDLEIVGGNAISDASGGATIDSEARVAINNLLAEMRSRGIINT